MSAFGAPVPVRICYEASAQPPYQLGQDSVPQTNPGYAVELTDSAVAQAGARAQFYRSSWKRCIEDLKDGRADALQAMIWTAERDRWVVFPKDAAGNPDYKRSLGEGVYRIYTRRRSALSWDGERFSGIRYGIGTPLGYISYQRLQALGVLSDQNLEQSEGLHLVARGRLDAYVVDQLVGNRLLQELGLTRQLKALPRPLMREFWYLVFAPDFYRAHPEQVETIWTAVGERRRRQGDALMQKYLRLAQ